MKKMKVLLVVCLALFALAGCENPKNDGNIVETETDNSAPAPQLTVLETSRDFYYVVDRTTNVVYLMYDHGSGKYRSTSMTAMFNADGSVITADQLGIKLDSTK